MCGEKYQQIKLAKARAYPAETTAHPSKSKDADLLLCRVLHKVPLSQCWKRWLAPSKFVPPSEHRSWLHLASKPLGASFPQHGKLSTTCPKRILTWKGFCRTSLPDTCIPGCSLQKPISRGTVHVAESESSPVPVIWHATDQALPKNSWKGACECIIRQWNIKPCQLPT